MDMLPEPSISFTIPSLYHDTLLECRIYHPKQPGAVVYSPEIKAVTIAHPYTPMGGCFDDHVLHAAGLEFLRQGYILGLFNLRGAGASQGHTSWSSKPEQDDYSSFVGFLSCYMEELQHCFAQQPDLKAPVLLGSPEQIPATKADHIHETYHNGSQEKPKQRVLVLGGYSYGSFIVRQLPDIAAILDRFTNPVTGTAADEIKLRAAHLAQERFHEQQAIKAKGEALSLEACPGSPIYGGDECKPGLRTANHDPRRSLDIMRKSMEKARAHFSKHHRDGHGSAHTIPTPTSTHVPEIRYLLISPILPPISAFLALSSHWWKADPAAEERLRQHQSLAVWGTDDFFTSSKRLQKWANTLTGAHGSRFEYSEFPGVGHFWLEASAEMDLRRAIKSWIKKCGDN